ncbi:MAG TPA: exonuclease domain-containing protein [bacterium]|nr:exonuclease domain-containing protein [bacterium]HPP87697.1 exonuclease domain-containing protein [bacterium]
MSFSENSLPEKYFVIDFENTGGSLWSGHMITAYGICIVEKIDDKYEITNTYMNYINPQREIPKFIEDLIGIKTDDVNNDKYPIIADEFEKIEELITDDMVFTAHSVAVDYSMFNYHYFNKYGRDFKTLALDTCILAKKILKLERAGISNAALYFGLAGKHHQPDFDAFVAAKILIKSLELTETNEDYLKIFKASLKKYPTKKHIKKTTKQEKLYKEQIEYETRYNVRFPRT